MRRLLTLALVLGLAALVAAAAVDALRSRTTELVTGTTEPPSEAGETPRVTVQVDEHAGWIEEAAVLADRLRGTGVRGTLYLSADGCLDGRQRRLRTLALPDLALAEGPPARSCAFSLSADGRDTGGPDAAWSPVVPVLAAQTGPDGFEVIDVRGAGRLELPGSAPAFDPGGRLLHAREGRIVEWSNDCATAREVVSPPLALAPGQIGPYCSRTAVSPAQLARALPAADGAGSIEALVPAGDGRLLVVLRRGRGSWLAAFDAGRSLGYGNGLTSHLAGPPRVDPKGAYVALSPGGYLEVFDRDAGRVLATSVRTSAYDWSPDGAWLAYADRSNVYLVRTSDWTTRYSIPVSTESLAWR